MTTTPAIPSRYAGIDQPRNLVGELRFGARDQIAYLDGRRRAHVVRVERIAGRYAVIDHCDGRALVVETLGTFDSRAAADAIALDWAIQARLYATGRRDTNPRPREARPHETHPQTVSARQETLAA